MSLQVIIPQTNRDRSHSTPKPTEAQVDESVPSPDVVKWDSVLDPGDAGRGDWRVLGSLEKMGQNERSTVLMIEISL